MDLSLTTMTALAAFATGLLTSVHCVGMCGPLACSVTSSAKSPEHAQLEGLAYHVGRIISYSLIGGLAGAIGEQPLSYFFDSPAVLLPWLMIPFIILSAFPNLIKLPRLKFLTMPYYRMRAWAQKKPAGVLGGVLGLMSPCLPCAPLYLVFGVSLASGSVFTGIKIALCFSLGTIPLLWLAQSSLHLLKKKVPTKLRFATKLAFVGLMTYMLTSRLSATFQSGWLARVAHQDTQEAELSEPLAGTPAVNSSAKPATELENKAKRSARKLPSCCHGKK